MFADSPSGRQERPQCGRRRSFLLHQAEVKEATDSAARIAGTGQLLERVASIPNLDRFIHTPRGDPLSPLLSSVVLDELDWELERRELQFVRYADYFSVFVRSERSGRTTRRLKVHTPMKTMKAIKPLYTQGSPYRTR